MIVNICPPYSSCNIDFLFFYFAPNQLLLFLKKKKKNGWCYHRLYRILGWNYTGEQDEVYPELQVD